MYPGSDECREVHGLTEHHPVDHLDVVVPHKARGAGGGERGVGLSSSHTGVLHTGWQGETRVNTYCDRGSNHHFNIEYA